MLVRRKTCFFFLMLLFLLFFSQETWGASQDYQVSKRALSDSFRGVLDGMGAVGKGVWNMTTSAGKLLWHGTREGLTQGARGAKKTDSWLQKHLW